MISSIDFCEESIEKYRINTPVYTSFSQGMQII